MRRAVVLMPNGLTLFNLFCGIYAIILALHDRIAEAPGFIVLGGIADTLDGRVARATGTGSRFGEELDSLVDAISFGFAPALIVFLGRPKELQGNLDWLLVFIFTACAVMRLARFNVEQAGRKKTHFHGLPSPAAGLTLATYYWFAQTPLYNQTVILFTDSRTLATLPWPNMMRGLMAILAALMVSDVPYPAVPSIGFNSVKKLLGTLTIATSLVLLLVRREEFIFPALLAYVVYGIVKWMTLGFIGRASTPDEIFWEREAELHQEDERRSAFDRPHISKEALEEVDDEDEEPVRSSRERSARREERGGERGERGDRGDREGRRDREERRPKRRDGERREGGKREESKREEAKRDEPREGREGRESRRDEPRRDRARRPDSPRSDSPRSESPRSETRSEGARSPEAARPDAPRGEIVPIESLAPSEAVIEAGNELPTTEERREPNRGPDDEIQVRKRRRRRGRGNRSRGERSAGGEDVGSTGAESGDDSTESHHDSTESRPESRGDAPSGPSLPDTPNPSGPTE